MKKKISHMVMMGDSLSDRRTADKRLLFGCIPMSLLSGLSGTSPMGRFTNGYVWSDVISAMFASDFIIKDLRTKYKYTNDDIADAVVAKDRKVMDSLRYDYNLNNDRFVHFEGKDFIRSYSEGGLSAYNYAWKLSSSIVRFFTRLILSTLESKRVKMLDYDKEHQLSKRHKAQTLVVEWSGANDLVTVNARPSLLEVDRAVKERIKNIEVLIKNGYRNFVLFNLPDLSLTPRFQNMTGEEGEKERQNAKDCVLYFNQELDKACQKLQTLYPHFTVDVFDINTIFTDVHSNPKAYRLDPEKLKQPYTTSVDFKILPNGTSPAKGYMFWDDIHPTADVHALLANKFYEKYNRKYVISEPEDESVKEAEINIGEAELKRAFCACYREKLTKDRQSFFGHLRKSKIDYPNASLEDIMLHALSKEGTRTREVITKLQWIDAEGKLNVNIPALRTALHASPKLALRNLG